VGGPCGGCGVLVFNKLLAVNMVPFCIIGGFLSLNHAKSGCAVTRRTFLCNRLTIRQDALSHHALMWQDAFSKRQVELMEDYV